jgi:lipoprotein-anchoring transpeptidase ErfK/SrfK
MRKYGIIGLVLVLVVGLIIYFFPKKHSTGNKKLQKVVKKVNLDEVSKMLSSGNIEGAIRKLKYIFENDSSEKGFQAGLKLVDLYKKGKQFAFARNVCQSLIERFPSHQNIGKIQNELWDLNLKVLLSPLKTENSFFYEVKKGDTLTKIAKEFNTTVGLIKRCNGLLSDKIIPGQRLKIIKGKFDVVVDKSQNTLTLRLNNKIIKVYKVSTGVNNSTPVGKFKIVNKIINPVWYKQGAVVPPDSPENILGSRWLGLSIKGYGIHGTTQPETIGRYITKGCIRMLSKDVEELYDILPVGTEVTIVD